MIDSDEIENVERCDVWCIACKLNVECNVILIFEYVSSCPAEQVPIDQSIGNFFSSNMKELVGTYLSNQFIISTIVIQSVKQYSFYSLFCSRWRDATNETPKHVSIAAHRSSTSFLFYYFSLFVFGFLFGNWHGHSLNILTKDPFPVSSGDSISLSQSLAHHAQPTSLIVNRHILKCRWLITYVRRNKNTDKHLGTFHSANDDSDMMISL